MFRVNDAYFSTIECPNIRQNNKCQITNCIFSHPISKKRSHPDEETDGSNKKAKDISMILPKSLANSKVSRTTRSTAAKELAKFFQSQKTVENPNKEAVEEEFKICSESTSEDEYRRRIKSITQPQAKISNISSRGVKLADIDTLKDPRFILPREIPGGAAPASIQDRKKFIQSIVDIYKASVPDFQTPILRATEDEFKIATSTTSNTYSQTIKRFAYDLKRNPDKILSSSTQKNEMSEKELISKLNELVIPKEKLEKFGYIMDIPPPASIFEETEDVRPCKRCGKEFKLSTQQEPTKCLYHSGRNRKKGRLVREWTCCGGTVGDCDPCSVAEHHVYQWSTPTELDTAIPFTHTGDLPLSKNAFAALGLDCEMGYTTMGFELLRTTVIDFVTGEEVLDILVKPKGKVIDLNTKWSGVAEIKGESVTFEDHLSLLNEVLDKNTILVGHGLENDLNAMRIIHDKIVDTAILYPKHKVTPQMRFSLKYLCFTYLGRTIQTGEHDSSEDSLGAIDVVKYFIKKEHGH